MFRCGWFVYLLMAGLILVVGFCVRVLGFTLCCVSVWVEFYLSACVFCFLGGEGVQYMC